MYLVQRNVLQLLTFVCLFLPPISASQELAVTEDAFINSGNSSRNYGSKDFLKISSWNSRTALLRFDTSAVNGNIVQSATMRLPIDSVSNAGDIEIYLVQSDWRENDVTAAQAPIYEPFPILTTVIDDDAGNSEIVLDVTGLVQFWLASPESNFGVMIRPGDQGSVSISIRSRESGTGASLSVAAMGSGENMPPTAVDDSFTVTQNAVGAFLDVLANDSDPDFFTDILSVVGVGTSSSGALVFNDGDSLSYSAAGGFLGNDSFDYTITDGAGNEASASVVVEVIEAPAVAQDIEVAVSRDSFTNEGRATRNYGSKTTMKVSSWNSRTAYLAADLSSLAATSIIAASIAVTPQSVANAGQIDFHLIAENWNESTINAANAPQVDPVPVASLFVTEADAGRQLIVDLPGAVQSWVASPNTNFGIALLPSGGSSVSLTLPSREGAAGAAFLINPSNTGAGSAHAPVANDDVYSFSQPVSNVVLDVIANDTDPDLPADSLMISAIGATSAGGTVINNVSSLSYSALPGFNGTESFTYTIVDSEGLGSTASVEVEIDQAGAAGTWRIMPLGDSITEASGSRNSFRRPLWQALNDAGFDTDFVGSRSGNRDGEAPNPDFDTDHEGHWGWRADRFLNNNNILNWAQTHRPDVALIHLGTNDIFNGQSVSSTISELGEIIDDLRTANPDIAILLAQIIPTSDTSRPSLAPLNQAIPGLAADKTTARSPVIVVDQNSGFNAETDTYDDVHPNIDGENKIANRWFEALVPILSN